MRIADIERRLRLGTVRHSDHLEDMIPGSSREESLHHFTGHVGETKIAATVPVGEALVVEAHEVEDGGVEIMHMDVVPCHAHAVLVGFTINDARSHARASQPGTECPTVMFTTFGIG